MDCLVALTDLRKKDAERVADAAKALDRVYPGWHNCVNVGTLDLMSPTNCVLGQVDHGKNHVWRRLWRTKGWSRLEYELETSMKMSPYPGLFASNHAFRDLWIKEIEARCTPWQEMLAATVVIQDEIISTSKREPITF